MLQIESCGPSTLRRVLRLRRWRRAAAASGAHGAAHRPRSDDYAERHSFADFAHWVQPGHVLVGQYPWRNEHNCPTRDEAEARLMRIVSAGISTFVMLLAGVPRQQDMPLAGKEGYQPYKATADLMAAGAPPRPMDNAAQGSQQCRWRPHIPHTPLRLRVRLGDLCDALGRVSGRPCTKAPQRRVRRAERPAAS